MSILPCRLNQPHRSAPSPARRAPRHRRGVAHRAGQADRRADPHRRDVGLAEEFAQEALVAALRQWPDEGVPDKPGAWLMATAKRRAFDHLRRNKMLQRKHEQIGRELEIDGSV